MSEVIKKVYSAGDLARRYREQGETLPNKFILYGPPGSGKTLLAATICQVPGLDRIIWCDLEDGFPTVLTARKPDGSYFFTPAELDRITLLPIPDNTILDPGTMDVLKAGAIDKEHNALAAKVLLKHIALPGIRHYDPEQQKILLKATESTVSWNIRNLGPKDVLVIDSGTQLASSIFSLAIESNPGHDHGKKHWAEFTTNAMALLSAIQAAKCMVIMICHSLEQEKDIETGRKAKTLPWFGSAPFSQKVGHYFGSVLYLYTDGKYRSLSTPLTKLTVQGKSRFSIDSSRITNPTMLDVLGLSARGKKAYTTIGGNAVTEKSKGTATTPAPKSGVKVVPKAK